MSWLAKVGCWISLICREVGIDPEKLKCLGKNCKLMNAAMDGWIAKAKMFDERLLKIVQDL